MTRPPLAQGSGTAAAAVLWAAALRLAADVTRHSPAAARDAKWPAAGDFGPPWEALVGRWRGEERAAGISAGELVATFDFELGGGVMTHRACGGAPALSPGSLPHEALMTFFPRAGGRDADAVRYDNAGHALCLEATWSADGRGLVATSPAEAGEARWRWTWQLQDADTLYTRQERAATGCDDFATQASATLRRAQ
jgi:hypothetical protein